VAPGGAESQGGGHGTPLALQGRDQTSPAAKTPPAVHPGGRRRLPARTFRNLFANRRAGPRPDRFASRLRRARAPAAARFPHFPNRSIKAALASKLSNRRTGFPVSRAAPWRTAGKPWQAASRKGWSALHSTVPWPRARRGRSSDLNHSPPARRSIPPRW